MSKHNSNAGQDKNEKALILVVEDDFELRTVICSELEEEFVVLEADNGQDGLEKALEQGPDLIVTDLMMPVMDGVELCRELKTKVDTSHMPVIMLTAQSSVENQIIGLETGADAYITKPFLMELLIARIHNLLKSRRQLYRRFREPLDESEMPELLQLQNSRDREFVEKTYSVLKQHYAEIDFSIDSLAADLGLSRRSMQRKIKVLFNQAPLQLITEYRLNQAVKLLQNTSVNITDVANQAGFGDLSHFYRVFKKEFSKAPSQYRDEEL
jgi:DNA-binding response OmpR family regulator